MLRKYFGLDELMRLESFLKFENRTILCDEEISKDFLRTLNQTNSNYVPDFIQAFLNLIVGVADPKTKSINPLYFGVLLRYLENVMSFQTFIKLFEEDANKTSKLYLLSSTKQVLEQFFAQLEAEFGEILIKTFMGYLAVYQFCGGITQNELLDLVSLDKQLMNMINFDRTSYKSLPECLWIQIKRSLIKLDLIDEVHNLDGYRCIVFKHFHFYEIVTARYFKTRDLNATAFHRGAASYYLNEHEKNGVQQAARQPIEQKTSVFFLIFQIISSIGTNFSGPLYLRTIGFSNTLNSEVGPSNDSYQTIDASTASH